MMKISSSSMMMKMLVTWFPKQSQSEVNVVLLVSLRIVHCVNIGSVRQSGIYETRCRRLQTKDDVFFYLTIWHSG